MKRFDEVAGLLNHAFDHSQDYTPVFEQYVPWYQKTVVPLIYSSTGATAGKKWKDLTPRYREWKNRHFPGMHILICSGTMYSAAMGGPGAVQQIGTKTATFGIDLGAVPYARAHQYGYSARNLPSRPYLFSRDGGVPGRAAQMLKDMILRHLKETA